jgi:PAS domain S-box-containing protein
LPDGTRHRLEPYLIAVLGVALVTILRLPFEELLAGRSPYTVYYLPILFVAWRAGPGPTVATTVLSLLTAKYFFVPERHSFVVGPGEAAAMALFLLSAAAMGILSRRASMLRERAVRNERACRRAERGARAAVWDWNADSGTFDTVALAGLFGIEGPPGTLTAERLEALVHPDDRVLFREGLVRARDSVEPAGAEFRILHPTRGLRWIATTGERSAHGPGGRWVSGVALDITARRQAEEAAAEQREWFEVTLRSIGDAVIAADREGRITFLNGVAEALTGWDGPQAMGRPLAEVFHIINEKTREPVENPADKVMRTGVVIGLANHTALIARDGTERPIADSAAPILGRNGATLGVILVFHDVTAERRAADEVAEQREWFQKTLESIGDGVIASDVRGHVEFMNPVAEYLTGTRLADARGRDCAEVFRIVNEATRAPVESPVGRVLREGNIVGLVNHTVLIARNGSERPIDDSGAPIRSRDGRIVGVVLVFRDVSERRRAEQDKQAAANERERLLDSERAARSEAERANRLKDEFVATLSHELRTPLNAILGWVRVLQMTPADEKTLRQALDVIDRQTRLQAQLISDLLDMSRILSGKMHLEVQSVDLGEILEAAMEAVRPALEARRIELRKELEPVPRIVADPARMQQILWNLLANAVKFTHEGGRVAVSVRSREGYAEISVSDTGKGIQPDFLAHVFERFRQAEGTPSRRFGGLGLGLAIVKQLVELHGGSIAVTSEGEGRGATFLVRLPVGSEGLAHPGGAGSEDPCQRIAEVASHRLKKLRVLVVEDEKDTRDLIVRILQECGAEVSAAASGAEALAMVEARPPELLICDIGMPVMDGYTLIQRIRQSANPRVARAPAIALTAFARPEDRSHALRSGFQAHLTKPMEPADLVATVASFADLIDPRRDESGA